MGDFEVQDAQTMVVCDAILAEYKQQVLKDTGKPAPQSLAYLLHFAKALLLMAIHHPGDFRQLLLDLCMMLVVRPGSDHAIVIRRSFIVSVHPNEGTHPIKVVDLRGREWYLTMAEALKLGLLIKSRGKFVPVEHPRLISDVDILRLRLILLILRWGQEAGLFELSMNVTRDGGVELGVNSFDSLVGRISFKQFLQMGYDAMDRLDPTRNCLWRILQRAQQEQPARSFSAEVEISRRNPRVLRDGSMQPGGTQHKLGPTFEVENNGLLDLAQGLGSHTDLIQVRDNDGNTVLRAVHVGTDGEEHEPRMTPSGVPLLGGFTAANRARHHRPVYRIGWDIGLFRFDERALQFVAATSKRTLWSRSNKPFVKVLPEQIRYRFSVNGAKIKAYSRDAFTREAISHFLVLTGEKTFINEDGKTVVYLMHTRVDSAGLSDKRYEAAITNRQKFGAWMASRGVELLNPENANRNRVLIKRDPREMAAFMGTIRGYVETPGAAGLIEFVRPDPGQFGSDAKRMIRAGCRRCGAKYRPSKDGIEAPVSVWKVKPHAFICRECGKETWRVSARFYIPVSEFPMLNMSGKSGTHVGVQVYGPLVKQLLHKMQSRPGARSLLNGDKAVTVRDAIDAIREDRSKSGERKLRRLNALLLKVRKTLAAIPQGGSRLTKAKRDRLESELSMAMSEVAVTCENRSPRGLTRLSGLKAELIAILKTQ